MLEPAAEVESIADAPPGEAAPVVPQAADEAAERDEPVSNVSAQAPPSDVVEADAEADEE
jgi:hypothetical protein